MISFSILENEDLKRQYNSCEPIFFSDLNIDQIINTITLGKDQYDLKPFIYTPLKDENDIIYRHEVFKDLEDKNLYDAVKSFSDSMESMREHLKRSKKMYYKYQSQSYFLDAVEIYCDAVKCLYNSILKLNLTSRGFIRLKEYLNSYIKSDYFLFLFNESKKIKQQISEIKYTIHIKGSKVKVQKYESQKDYYSEVENLFRKFSLKSVKDYRVEFNDYPEMNHVEAMILDCVAKLYSPIFENLNNFCSSNVDFLDENLSNFDREIQFYISYIDFINVLKQNSLPFCYPKIDSTSKDIYAYDAFDLSLAYKLNCEHTPIILNDFYLKEKERIFVITGPNQGGKTTFARMFGQLHYIASLGCPIPSKDAHLFLYDEIFTLFERPEDIKSGNGKLQEELFRIKDILNNATHKSIIILNEVFASTSLRDSIFLGKEIINKISKLDCLCIYVTFIYELSSINEKVVSLVSTVCDNDPNIRTYKIIRSPADGLSYAISISKKYNLTYENIKERIKNDAASTL